MILLKFRQICSFFLSSAITARYEICHDVLKAQWIFGNFLRYTKQNLTAKFGSLTSRQLWIFWYSEWSVILGAVASIDRLDVYNHLSLFWENPFKNFFVFKTLEL